MMRGSVTTADSSQHSTFVDVGMEKVVHLVEKVRPGTIFAFSIREIILPLSYKLTTHDAAVVI